MIGGIERGGRVSYGLHCHADRRLMHGVAKLNLPVAGKSSQTIGQSQFQHHKIWPMIRNTPDFSVHTSVTRMLCKIAGMMFLEGKYLPIDFG